jgi:oxygen-independent coproporphyrinogen III oxidase
MPLQLVAFEQKVPRYTSYPTAPHFKASIDDASYEDWLKVLPATATLSLYLHVPYCASLCTYCGCHTQVLRRKEPLLRYAELLRRELDLVQGAMPARSVTHIQWGGGTPSILGEASLSNVADHLAKSFDLGRLREYAIELDPRHVSPGLTQTLVRIGVNRASLGVQTFAPHVQAAIGRVQPEPIVARTVERLRAAGIGQLSFDLMYGLPLQTLDDVRDSIARAVAMAPQRIALFGYAHVPWFRPRQHLINASDLPGSSERFEQAETARRVLCAAGYQPIGLDHFAVPSDRLAIAARSGRLHRNFQGYTDDAADALIGLGASAIGRLPQGFIQNVPDVREYASRIEQGTFATARGIALSQDDRWRASIIEDLMCSLCAEVPPGWFSTVAGLAVRAQLRPLECGGLAEVRANRVLVTEAGRPFLRTIAAAFDAYLTAGETRHSAAV